MNRIQELFSLYQIKTMKKLLLVAILGLTSCVNQMDRLKDAQKKYPKCIVQPTTSILAANGYDIMVEDTVTDQIYVLSYYSFSTTKISSIRNIK
jgi:hypothetical protein